MSMGKSCIWCNVHHLNMANGEMIAANRHQDRTIDNSNGLTIVSHVLRCMEMRCTWVPCLCQQSLWRVMVKYFNKSSLYIYVCNKVTVPVIGRIPILGQILFSDMLKNQQTYMIKSYFNLKWLIIKTVTLDNWLENWMGNI